MQLTYDELTENLDLKYVPSKRIGYTLPSGIHETKHLNKALQHLLPDNEKVSITIDDIRQRSNLYTNQTLIFTLKKSFFYTILGFNQSLSGFLGDIEGFFQIRQEHNKAVNLLILMELMKFF